MRWRVPVFTVLVLLTISMAALFAVFCLKLKEEGTVTPLLIGAVSAGTLTLFGVWASERCYRDF
jgi:hypothetical protein